MSAFMLVKMLVYTDEADQAERMGADMAEIEEEHTEPVTGYFDPTLITGMYARPGHPEHTFFHILHDPDPFLAVEPLAQFRKRVELERQQHQVLWVKEN